MLINVFGIWLMAAQIVYLSPVSPPPGCIVWFGTITQMVFKNKSCDEVATEINKQLKGGKDGLQSTK